MCVYDLRVAVVTTYSDEVYISPTILIYNFPTTFFIQNHCHICFLETLAIYYKYQTNSVWQSSTSAAVCKTNISTFTDLVNRPLHGFRRRRHLGCGGVAARITANVWDIVQLSTLITPQLYNRSWQKRCLLKGIGMEIM